MFVIRKSFLGSTVILTGRKSLKPFFTRPSTFLVAVGFSLSVLTTACASNTSTTPNTNPPSSSPVSSSNVTQPVKNNVIHVGYQKYGTLNILKAKGSLEERLKPEGVSVRWIQFPGGPQLLEALNVGSIDYGHTGEAPPIFAQAAGANLIYVANEPPNPKGEAILVPKDSPIQDVAGLKGKKIALNKGSNVHYLLVQALTAAGLKYSDIKPVYLPPAEGRAAFESGNADAWVIWDPFLTVAQKATGARILKNAEGLAANREFYLAAKPFADQYPERVKAIFEEIQKVDEWAAKNATGVATLLSPQLSIDVPTLEEISKRRPYGIQPIQADVVKYQQQVADTFHQLGLLPKSVNVEEVTQRPKP